MRDKKPLPLPENYIYVYGSHKGGFPKRGAAKDIAKYFNGNSPLEEGLRNQAYAIPIKSNGSSKLISNVEIKEGIDRFLAFAHRNPQLIFNTLSLVHELSLKLDVRKLLPRNLALNIVEIPLEVQKTPHSP